MATVNFLYRSTKPSATLNIRLLFRHNNKDYSIGEKTRYIVPKFYWENYHDSKQIKNAKTKALQAKTKNELYQIESNVLEAFHKVSAELVNKEWLTKVLEEYYKPRIGGKEDNDNLINQFEDYIKFKGNDLAHSTIKRYRGVKNLLGRYESDSNKKLLVSEINQAFKSDFEEYCFSDGYSPNTISKAFKTIKTICKHASKKGASVSNELVDVKLRTVDSEKIYLSLEDIKKIEDLQGIPEYLENARDWLIISCYTGQRISDFMRFNSSMIKSAVNKKDESKKLIHFEQIKTKTKIALPLQDEVIKILDKRSGEFPRAISDQNYNIYIKEVCKQSGLTYEVMGSKKEPFGHSDGKWRKKIGEFEKWELVTSHIGRRSFATNYYGKIPTVYLMQATGHKREEMFLKYIGKNSQDLALELAEYF